MIRKKLDNDDVRCMAKLVEQEILYRMFIKYEYRGYGLFTVEKDFNNFLGRLLEGNLPKSLTRREIEIVNNWRNVMKDLGV